MNNDRLSLLWTASWALILAAIIWIATSCAKDDITGPTDQGPKITLSAITDSSVLVNATWRSPAVGLVFPWTSVGPTWSLAGLAEVPAVSFTVPRIADDATGRFCVRSRRLFDGKESVDTCALFVVPGNSLPPPPDSLGIKISWRVITPRWDGDSVGIGIYFPPVPNVDRWSFLIWQGGQWTEVGTALDTLYPLGTPVNTPTRIGSCETIYTYTGDPARPANSGPHPDGSDWQCVFDVDPYFTANWTFPRNGATYGTRVEGYTLKGILIAYWSGIWKMPPK